ncbi:aldolase/citrate lyase family protein [Sporosarcina sp. G11-34]|uniref:aldolase/citrate lyase family protein n=1 Tax=Sporosarcina sp. G11-34 TaxID=2849605 RepID=UPI0022A9B451|nr:aldolase/citrate lyase family protein [Sporosarcina sp. G11-34]MCZ2258630.1 hypothetical protein [Sporosarcina sp. G11-34]
MFENYFFVPANKQQYILKSETLPGINNRIFDFEDSILKEDIDLSIDLLSMTVVRSNDWIRLPSEIPALTKVLKGTHSLGFNNYIIPKFKGIKELTLIIQQILIYNKHPKLILLIENSLALIELKDIINKFDALIYGFGLGSHDFSLDTGIENDLPYLQTIRINLLILAKAYNKEPIDIVSMNISNEKEFRNEIDDGFNCGYRSKFLIHPLQLKMLNNHSYYSFEEVMKYKEILDYFKMNIKDKNALFFYEGKVYEKMHIKKIEQIVNWGIIHYETIR